MTVSNLNDFSWNTRQLYIDAIKQLRMQELTSSHRVAAVITGLSSIIPYQVLAIMSPYDLEIRTSGRPQISLDFLKVDRACHVCRLVDHWWFFFSFYQFVSII